VEGGEEKKDDGRPSKPFQIDPNRTKNKTLKRGGKKGQKKQGGRGKRRKGGDHKCASGGVACKGGKKKKQCCVGGGESGIRLLKGGGRKFQGGEGRNLGSVPHPQPTNGAVKVRD